MHLLAAQPGSLNDGGEAVDLGQSPAEVVILSAADTELAALAAAHDRAGRPCSLRLANLLRLAHHMSVDLYVDQVIRHARLVIVRLLGGRSYWPHGVDQIAATCRRHGIALALLPGDDRPDPGLSEASTLAPAALARVWSWLSQGGPGNLASLMAFAAGGDDWLEPAPLPPAGRYGRPSPAGDTRPRALVVFYRALLLAGDLAPIDALLAALDARGLAATALYVQSLKDGPSAALAEQVVGDLAPDVIVNATGFAVAAPGRPQDSPLAPADCPVVQVVLAAGTEAEWQDGTRGLSPRDIAMNVALPEVDGRLLAGAISFKAATRDEATQCDLARHRPVAGQIDFAADLVAAWAGLRRRPVKERRVAVVLANYPNRDGRLGNGVGLDTPAATVVVLRALAAAGYDVENLPADAAVLMAHLRSGVTNDWRALEQRQWRDGLDRASHDAGLAALPEAARAALLARWGQPEDDPFYRPDPASPGGGRFVLPVLRLGRVAVAIQPARGYNIDPADSYHSPDLVPPHNYLAFHLWLRHAFAADALIQMGKHGNLEWLPGKALALSAACWPRACLGPLPTLYPFIVNDPGEGTQAKRRIGAAIIDHLTPPLTRAETYGPLRELERLVDEYYQAAGLDPRRLAPLRRDILSLTALAGLDHDLGIGTDTPDDEALNRLDNHLCELKELQIRDGLHIFGESPEGAQRTGLLVALARCPRGPEPGQKSLHRAIAADLGLDFDPLDCVPATPWSGPRPASLAAIDTDNPWRSQGDTVERIEVLAHALVGGDHDCAADWPQTRAVLADIAATLAPAVDGCGAAEITALLRGLDGRFVLPGPSGAPTRGRPDVLPTGRNFYSVDTRAVPTPAAWLLGWKSAQALTQAHLQDHGDWPRQVALTAWGTSNMRTGGDDIAQGLALMGVRPTWDSASTRVTGFEILPATMLDRPRVDVTLRVSGFFRDAFPDLVALFDRAARAVAALDEDGDTNPLAAQVRQDKERLGEAMAAARVFGSMPGAYGAGLQALIDEGGWGERADLAAAYVAWGGWIYGADNAGEAGHDALRHRLSQVEAVIHNQDNREHDLLDSDDYYQFEGGLAAAVEAERGLAPVVYHPDHSRPESPRIRTLEQEIARVVRGRAVNPKWIEGVMRHGYKGAFEMAATLDYLFAFAATTNAVKPHHFDLIADAYLGDDPVRDFLEANNPAALEEIKARLREAMTRGLWRPRRNWLSELLKTDT